MKAVVTSSWDDGVPADLRLADLLVERGAHGTFYVCRDFEGRPRLSDRQICELDQRPGLEVAAHTLTHPDLRKSSPAELRNELEGGRAWLEDVLGRSVPGVAYPRGRHNKRVVDATRQADYAWARTTMGGHVSRAEDPHRMWTTQQVYPHRKSTQLRHALKELDASGFLGIVALKRWSKVPKELLGEFSQLRDGEAVPVVHVWGHSWELQELDWWKVLDELLSATVDFGWRWCRNSELLAPVERGLL